MRDREAVDDIGIALPLLVRIVVAARRPTPRCSRSSQLPGNRGAIDASGLPSAV